MIAGRKFAAALCLGAIAIGSSVAQVAWGQEAAAKPEIPGFRLVGDKYLPAEPFQEGQPRATGLQHPFPAMKSLAENPMTPEKVALGKLLYFDPILSGDNTTSCAHCHHPDFGFSDGRKTSMGKGGTGVGPARTGGDVLPRNAPTIWNAAYSTFQFWDGRAKDLEQQAEGPIQDAHEMNQNADEAVKEVKAIPEYVDHFKKVFGGEADAAVTFRNITMAIAAFERTILSFNSKFDRYAAGDFAAMNEQEKRGMNLFRSLKTRCFECHSMPYFSDNTFRIIGVPEDDGTYNMGRAKVPEQGPFGAFKVPTLRNIALNAPYMHNGKFATLEEVIKFYAEGGGRREKVQIENIDDKISKFDITPEETADLVSFLHALTDTSLQPEAPTKVPSGLPVVEVKSKAVPQPAMQPLSGRNIGRVSQPGTSTIASSASAVPAAYAPSQTRTMPRIAPPHGSVSATFTVAPGQSIQAAVDRAEAGDRVEVLPGVYHQTITVDRAGIELVGLSINGERPVLDGQGTLPDAVLGSAGDFTIQGFIIRHYTGNGIVVNKAKNVVFRDLVVEDAGLYAVYPVECDGVLVEGCVVSGAKDAGIYVGQSRNIIVRNNEVFNNVAGIEIENSVNALVTNNSAHHNTCGILVFLLPNGASKVSSHCRVVNNRSWENNHVNFAKPGTIVSYLPKGTGMLIMAADHTEVTKNQIFGNESSGITMLSFLSSQTASKEKINLDIEPNPDNNLIHDNLFADNGKNPAPTLKIAKIPGSDLIWDGKGVGNGWREATEVTRFPEQLPTTSGMTPIDASMMGGI